MQFHSSGGIWSANQNTTSQIVINWQQRWTLTVFVEWYKTDFNVSENENVHINSSRLVLCVRSYHDLPHLLPLRGCVQPIKWNLTFSIFGNVYSRTVFGPTQHVLSSLWTKMVKSSSYQPILQWWVLGNKVFKSAGVYRNLLPVWVWMVITGV